MLTKEVLSNISIFMARAVEAGAIKNVTDAMAFAEALLAVQAAHDALSKAKK